LLGTRSGRAGGIAIQDSDLPRVPRPQRDSKCLVFPIKGRTQSGRTSVLSAKHRMILVVSHYLVQPPVGGGTKPKNQYTEKFA